MQYDYYMEEEVKAFVAHSEEWKNNTPVSKISNITWRPLGWDTRFVKHFWTSNQEGNIILLDFTHIPPISSSYRFLDMWKPNHSPFTQSWYTTLWTVYSCLSFFFPLKVWKLYLPKLLYTFTMFYLFIPCSKNIINSRALIYMFINHPCYNSNTCEWI